MTVEATRQPSDAFYGLPQVLKLNLRDQYFLAKYLAARQHPQSQQASILCNSFPKSGTHLLVQILTAASGLPQWSDLVATQSLAGPMNSLSHLKWKLLSAPPGTVIRSHLAAYPSVQHFLRQQRNLKQFLIIRDLRDVVVSHARWCAKEPRVHLYPVYSVLPLEERVRLSILGLSSGMHVGSNISHPNVGDHFRLWLPWLNDELVHVVRFEDLAGSAPTRDNALQHIITALGPLARVKSAEAVAEQLRPEDSPTFREGRTGTWRDVFTDEHVTLFKAVAGKELIASGYEADFNWCR